MSENVSTSLEQQAVWIPQEDEWYEATVSDRSLRKQLLVLKLTNDATVICISGKVTKGFVGHILCTHVPINTSCVVRIEPRNNGDYFAMECQFDSTEPIPAKVEESVVIVNWKEETTWGRGIRPCGCPVFTTTSGRMGGFQVLQEGDVVQCEIVPSTRKPGLAAAYVIEAAQGR